MKKISLFFCIRKAFPQIADFVLSMILGYYVCFFSIDWYSNQGLLLAKTFLFFKIVKTVKHLAKII